MKLKSFSLFIISLVTVELSGQTPVNGVRPFDVLAKNSLKFNKYIINPSFSHVREDESFISFYNKRKWIGFENSRTDYFFSLSGKFQDLNGYGIGLFQNNENIYSTFGVVGNFARNIEIIQDSNLTFGLNLAYINSGINSGKIITNVQESILSNVAKYSLISINPGINFGTGFFDIGIVANNLFYYNLNPSGLVQGNPAKNFGLHAMYTGYIDRDGILERAKFSALGRAEIGTGYTGFGASLLFNAPKAGWVQAGYDSLNGINAGIGFVLAKKLSIGYGIEKPLGNFSNFGLSHEFTLAYKLRGYGDYEDERPIVKASSKTNPKASDKAVAVKKKTPQELAKERAAELALKQQQEKARLEAERLRKEKELAEARAKAEMEARLKAEKDRLDALKAKEAAEARAKAEMEARLRAEQDKNKALSEAERQRQERLANEARLKAEAAAKLKAEQERLAKEKAGTDVKSKIEADAKAKAEALAREKAESERLAKEKAEAARLAKEKSEADTKAKAEALAREKAESERLAKEKSEADAKAKAEALAREKAESERLAKEKAEADAKAKAEALAREKAESERLAKEKAEADAKAKAEALAREKAESERLAKEKSEAEAKAKAEALAREKAESERLAKEKAEAEAKAKAEALAREKAESERLAKEKAEAEAKAKAEALAREKAESERLAKEKAEAEAKAKAEALAREKAESERLAKEKAEADAKAKAEALTREKAESERLAKEKSEAEAKAKAEALAREKAESERLAKEKSEAEAKAKAEALAREKAESERLAKEKSEAEAKAKAEALAREKAESERLAKEKSEAEELARKEALKTAEDKEIDNLSNVIEDSQKLQSESIKKFQSIVLEKEKELMAMRKANDDSEKGIVAPVQEVEFKSMSQANKAIESLKSEIALNIKQQDQFIAEYQTLAAERLKKIPNKNDVINQSYLKTIEKLKQDKARSEEESKQLITKLEDIKTQTEIEKRRRIKRANFEDASAKYQKDRATLSQIKASTTPTDQAYKSTDFDYGDSDQMNMQIVKNVPNEKAGFYMVLATHKDEARRDAFVKKAIQAGEKNIDFFYDISTGTYFIYSKHYDEINEADEAMKNKGEKPYNGKMVIIKIEK
ncbi:PorP/SprF family type IX secretion system membrane protein [Flavobacterium columnare]|uniref:PorP/SprF family type IX secretion system membrane protein n=1 Tax=Flavobacterium columnare TaxID=996 RepID=UPI0018965256|nr:PorP/SprF family type IX secretion system membrane protein [Flavobacterium columnare]MBF6659216.1 hypothetical protein [Flavobacterium columnare]